MQLCTLIGKPGAGKDTRISQILTEKPHIDICVISPGNLLRAAGINTNNGNLVDDDTVINLVSEKLLATKSALAVLNGFPRTLTQAVLIQSMGFLPNCVVHFEASDELVINRARDRLICSNKQCSHVYTKSDFHPPKIDGLCDECGNPLISRKDDTEKVVNRRLKIYRRDTEPILAYLGGCKVPIISIHTDEDNSRLERIFDNLVLGNPIS